jgi:hypothetical protein
VKSLYESSRANRFDDVSVGILDLWVSLSPDASRFRIRLDRVPDECGIELIHDRR